MMTLFHRRMCPFSMQVRIVLEEKGLAYESAEVEPGAAPPEALLGRNPGGEIPTLVDGEVVVFGPHVINEYLDERYPGVRLMPRTAPERAGARMLAGHFFTVLGPALEALHLERERAPEDQEQSALDRLQHEVRRGLEWVESRLGDSDYLTGAYGLADIELAPFATRLPWFGMEVAPPRLQAWIDRVCAHPAIARQTQPRAVAVQGDK